MTWLKQVWRFMRSDSYCRATAIVLIEDIMEGRK